MKFTLSWLKDHLETTATLEQICTALTGIGLEVESVEDPAEKLSGFVVAEIRHAEPHPDAQKLRVCKVANGQEELQIVCGAPNARAGIKVVLATLGAVVPANGMKIVKSKIRGVESQGMLCSEVELQIGDNDNGIMELPANLAIGQPVASQLGVDDPVIEIAITPDRADCLGVRGIARDLAAAGLGQLKPLAVPTVATSGKPSRIQATITQDNNGCQQFVGRSIQGVSNGESPGWLRHRLSAIGLRPISKLVDVTNYISVDLGRPLHVYDIAKLNGNITARKGRGERFLALNGKDYTATEQDTVIADATTALGFGGIIGGESSGCTEATCDVFLEVAYFEPVSIAETGRRHDIITDARYRFERGVDPDFLQQGAAIATHMILDLCGGTADELTIAGDAPYQPRSITFRPSRVATLGGMKVQAEKSEQILEMLGFTITRKENTGSTREPEAQKSAMCSPSDEAHALWHVAIPSWRGDVHGEADLVEEVMRIIGLDHLPATPLPRPAHLPDISLPLAARQSALLRRALATQGANEVHCYSFTQQEWAQHFGGGQQALRLLNPISSELDAMRPSLLPNLLAALKRNLDRGQEHITLSEVGNVYHGITPDTQSLHAAVVRGGQAVTINPHDKPRSMDVFDAKADALAALAAIGAPVDRVQIDPNGAPVWYHPGRSGAIKLGGKNTLAVFGELHPNTLKLFGIKQRAVACEIYPAAVPQAKAKGKARAKYAPSDLQAVSRDYSFLLAAAQPVEPLLRAVAGAERQIVTAVRVISDYQDESLKAQSLRSIALRVTLQPQQATFTEAEIDAISALILKAALKTEGVTLSEALQTYVQEKNLSL